MKHLEDIRVFVDVLLASKTFHALVIESPPGWGKSSAITQTLREKNLHYECISTYTTAYHLYTSLRQAPNALVVVDDCSGILSDPIALSVLKSATWPVSGPDEKRLLMWGSGEKDEGVIPIDFTGKLILLVNSMGQGIETKSFLSRALYLPILGNEAERSDLLLEAAKNREVYPNSEIANKVGEFLNSRLRHMAKVNLRTLRLGYELAEQFPERWELLIERLFCGQKSPDAVLQVLARSGLPVYEQVRRFIDETGLSRRTFFNLRKKA